MKESIDNVEIPSKLRDLRRSRGLTVHELAEQIGENYQKVGRIERGSRSLTIDYLLKISKAFNTPIDAFLAGEKKEEENALIDIEQKSGSLLNSIVIFIEENQHRILSCTPQKKAMLISKIFEIALHFPENCQEQFLESLFKTALLFLKDV